MFRRRPDLSWPLILLLLGLFVLGNRLPRSWERVARSSPLALGPRLAVTAATSNPTSPVAVESRDQATSSVVEPAGPVASSTQDTAATVAPATIEAPATTLAAAAPEVVPVSAERPREPEIAVAPSATLATAAEPDLPGPRLEPQVAAGAAPAGADEVHILRDLPATTPPPPAPSTELAAKADPTFCRLPATEPASTEVQTRMQPSSVAEVNLPTVGASAIPEPSSEVPQPSEVATGISRPVTPEPSLAVTQQEPALNTVSLPAHAVVPEPGSMVMEPVPQPSLEPMVAPPSGQVAEEHLAVEPDAKPVEKTPLTPGRYSVIADSRPIRAIGRAWEEPSFLLGQLEQLRKHEPAQAWATETINQIHKLGPAIAVGAPQTVEILDRLEELSRQGTALAEKTEDQAVAQDICRTAYALRPRIAIWKQIGQMGGMVAADAPAPSVDPHSFNKALADIDRLTADSSDGHAWRKYLLIDSLRDWAARRRNSDERMPRELAQQWQARLNRMSMTSQQRQFLTSGPMAALNREMVRSTAEAVESNRLLQHLEAFEKSGLPSDARLLARDCQYLSVSSGAAQRELDERVETYFRNGNIRIAVSAELLNRMMPKLETELAPVEDTIQGAAVRGKSLTQNEISVRMYPDPTRVRMALEVNGEVAAVTHSTSGPATFFTDSESSYIARKPLEITLRGIRMWPTEVSVDNNSQVRGVRTDFDRMPLLGSIVRDVSLSKYAERRPAADDEVRQKIAVKAKQRVDREATDQVTQAAKRLHDEVLGPMDSLLLDPLLISAETTDKRFNMRIRLAGPDQLGGHTPRPQAPADSLASLQIHESLLNNVLERLELDGQTFDLAGLNRRLSERIHRFQPKPIDPDQEDVKITFAANDAVHVRCSNGRLQITLAVARLSKGTRSFKDFQVRASYKPVVEGRLIDLTRDGIVQLIAPRMNAFTQTPLRSVFLKIFSDKQPIHLTPESFVKNPRLNGVAVTQFVINDGWIGAALGSQPRVAVKAAAASR